MNRRLIASPSSSSRGMCFPQLFVFNYSVLGHPLWMCFPIIPFCVLYGRRTYWTSFHFCFAALILFCVVPDYALQFSICALNRFIVLYVHRATTSPSQITVSYNRNPFLLSLPTDKRPLMTSPQGRNDEEPIESENFITRAVKSSQPLSSLHPFIKIMYYIITPASKSRSSSHSSCHPIHNGIFPSFICWKRKW